MNSVDTISKYGHIFHTLPATQFEEILLAKRLAKSIHSPVSAQIEDDQVVFRVMGDPKKALEALRKLSPSLFPDYVHNEVHTAQVVYAYYADGLKMRLMGCNWLAAKLARECRPGFKEFRGEKGRVLSRKVLSQLGA